MDELYLRLAALARRFGAKRLVLFGSRAEGTTAPTATWIWPCTGCRQTTEQNFGWNAKTCPRC